jgi:chromate reductase, NAD(P)H dehydrogenase (quinone)
MYTIISGTNRVGSNTLKVARQYQAILKQKGVDAGLLSLEHINVMERGTHFEKLESEIIIPTNNFIFIAPEYNGSFPGVLKMFFDTSKSNRLWWNKKALITGISSGRAGNLRGNDHLAAVLNYLKITVHPNQLPVSVIDKLLDEDGVITDENTLTAIHQQLDDFIVWCNRYQ